MDEQEIPRQPKEKPPGNQGKRYSVAEKAVILRIAEQTDIKTTSARYHVSEGMA